MDVIDTGYTVEEVELGTESPARFAQVLTSEAYSSLNESLERGASRLANRTFWHVNSTATGGGVAEMLQNQIPHLRGAGISSRWAVIQGNPDFFQITKRIHNNLHGEAGDGGELGQAEAEIYIKTLERNSKSLLGLLSKGDVVLLHDPQTAGLTNWLTEAGVHIIWRCHVGLDTPNAQTRKAWDFLRSFVQAASSNIFSRRAFVWEGLGPEGIELIAPSIDPFSPKNQEMDDQTVSSILAKCGLIDSSPTVAPRFQDRGSVKVVERAAKLAGNGNPPPPDAKIVTQVSRWDRLKDPLGVIEGFVKHVADRPDAHLVVAGPSVEGVTDDPEGTDVLAEAVAARGRLPESVRSRVHLASLPMEDVAENAAMVNALQRRSDIVVQKSLAEGFGLTVSEAMWKARAVIATKVGGIQDQIVNGESGILIDDPADLAAYGKAAADLLKDPERSGRLGKAAKQRVRDNFLDSRQLTQLVELAGKF